jgi:hypothetical protein
MPQAPVDLQHSPPAVLRFVAVSTLTLLILAVGITMAVDGQWSVALALLVGGTACTFLAALTFTKSRH